RKDGRAHHGGAPPDGEGPAVQVQGGRAGGVGAAGIVIQVERIETGHHDPDPPFARGKVDVGDTARLYLQYVQQVGPVGLGQGKIRPPSTQPGRQYQTRPVQGAVVRSGQAGPDTFGPQAGAVDSHGFPGPAQVGAGAQVGGEQRPRRV